MDGTSGTSNEGLLPSSTVNLSQSWRCDVCKVRTFATFDEACAHEDMCGRTVSLDQSDHSEDEPMALLPEKRLPESSGTHCSAKVTSSSLREPTCKPLQQKTNSKGSNAATKQSTTKTSSGRMHSFFSSASVKVDDSMVDLTSVSKPKPSASRKGLAKTTLSTSKAKKPVVDKDTPQPLHPSGRPRRQGASKTQQQNNSKQHQNLDGKITSKRAKSEASATASSSSAIAAADEVMVVENSKIVEEQRVLLQFMEQRRQQAQLEREKRERQLLRRIEHGDERPTTTFALRPYGDRADKAIDVDMDTENDEVAAVNVKANLLNQPAGFAKAEGSGKNAKSARRLALAPLFPATSHVMPAINTDKTMRPCKKDEEWSNSWKAVRRTRNETSDSDRILLDDHDTKLVPLFALHDRHISMSHGDCGGDDTSSSIQALLSSHFLAPSLDPSGMDGLTRDRSTMWVDRYYGTNALSSMGASRRNAHEHLHGFIKRFMVDRQKAEALMAERQKRKNEQGKKRKKAGPSKSARFRDDDDDFWDTDDEDAMAEQNSSICLITGPTGAGKSQLVHLVAAELGCRTVLELHTGTPRGAAATKRLVEEATKSHSTLEMMQKKKAKIGPVPSFFQKPQRHDLSDTESEDDEAASRHSNEGNEPCSAVTVILIDEIDNLYEGDSSIWSALAELYKQSKCPIVLTSNTFPKPLDSSTFQFQHIALDRPSVSECARQLHEILAAEQITTRDGVDDSESRMALERIATLGRCDLRKLIHEMSLFGVLPLQLDAGRKYVQPIKPAINNCRFHLPEIESVKPNSLPSRDFSLLTITGSNFWSLLAGDLDHSGCDDHERSCHVYVGQQQCPRACVVNDTTIMAVVGPLRALAGPDACQEGHRRIYSSTFAQVTVCSAIKLGIRSTSCGLLTCPDYERPSSAMKKQATIAYYFSGAFGETGSCNESSSEAEFEDSTNRGSLPASCGLGSHHVVVSAVHSIERATKLLIEGVEAWKSVHGELPTFPLVKASGANDTDVCLIDDLSHKANLASDCALFEDVGLTGAPYLAGSCNGFGFDLTDQFPKHTNDISKPPSEDRLFELGWKDSLYFYGNCETSMTRLAGSRERKLLKWSEPIVRGLSSAIPIVDGASEEESDEPRSSSNVTDEAMFLPTQVPTCLWTLPLHFRTAYVSSAPTQHDNSIERQRATNASNAFDVLYACIFPICTQARMRSCSMNRALDPLLLDRVNVLHDQIFLDYLPLLRCMAALERDAESAFRAIEEADPDAATDMSNRRRSTRCSRKLGREHYFEKVVPPFALRECGRTAKQVGELLASSLLVTCG